MADYTHIIDELDKKIEYYAQKGESNFCGELGHIKNLILDLHKD